MSKLPDISFATTHHIRDRCICLHMQRAARVLARRFDEALRPLDLTNGQFSLLTSLNRADPARMGSVATLLARERKTLTSPLKPLERRGLVAVSVDPDDQRSRLLTLTRAGRALLAKAVPIWKRAHGEVDRLLADGDPDALRRGLLKLGRA